MPGPVQILTEGEALAFQVHRVLSFAATVTLMVILCKISCVYLKPNSTVVYFCTEVYKRPELLHVLVAAISSKIHATEMENMELVEVH